MGRKGFLSGSMPPSLPTDLVVCAQLLAIGGECEQPTGGIHHAPDLQAIVVASLPGAHALARTHHIAVAAFDAELKKKKQHIFIFVRPQTWQKAYISCKLNLNYAAQATSSCCNGRGAQWARFCDSEQNSIDFVDILNQVLHVSEFGT